MTENSKYNSKNQSSSNKTHEKWIFRGIREIIGILVIVIIAFGVFSFDSESKQRIYSDLMAMGFSNDVQAAEKLYTKYYIVAFGIIFYSYLTIRDFVRKVERHVVIKSVSTIKIVYYGILVCYLVNFINLIFRIKYSSTTATIINISDKIAPFLMDNIVGWLLSILSWILVTIVAGILGGYAYDVFKNRIGLSEQNTEKQQTNSTK